MADPGVRAAVRRSRSCVALLANCAPTIVECPRRSGDPPGDPCVHRFREAVAAGAVPFSVQGPENAWCLDGGRTIGWEMARDFEDGVVGPPLDRVFVQVGGGAFAASVLAGFRMSGVTPRLHAVQTESCAPLAAGVGNGSTSSAVREAARRWDDCMWPWEHVGASAADGILDDETYDWIPVVRAMVEGQRLAGRGHRGQRARGQRPRPDGPPASTPRTPAPPASPACSPSADDLGSDERVAVIFSGVDRTVA